VLNKTSRLVLTFRQRAAGLIKLGMALAALRRAARVGLAHHGPVSHDPLYGDVLEGLWALIWYDDALRLGSSPALYPLAFHPVGFHVPTYAWGRPTSFF